MARLTAEQAEEMSKGTGGEFRFLTLDDKQVTKVRFLYDNPEEIEMRSVHNVRDSLGKSKNIDCLRAANEPVQKCPLCEMGNKPKARMFILMMSENNDDRGTIYVWERSGQFLEQLKGLYSRYGSLKDSIFEIQRYGKKGDTNTNYSVFYLKTEPAKDLPEKPEIVGRLILEKTYEECASFARTGTFPERTAPQVDETPYPSRQQVMNNYQQPAPTQQAVEVHYAPNPTQTITYNVNSKSPSECWDKSNVTTGNNNSNRRGW